MKKYKENEINELADVLNNNGVISVPTDTVYGVCARISSKKAHDNLVNVKDRPETKPFPVMCSNIEQIKSIAYVTNRDELIINKFMPGPITLILKSKDIPEYINNGMNTIAIRMTTSKTLEELINLTGPLFMSSANKSGKETCKTIEEIESTIPRLDGVLEGTVSFNKASTILDCTKDNLTVLREGPIDLSVIKKYLKEVRNYE